MARPISIEKLSGEKTQCDNFRKSKPENGNKTVTLFLPYTPWSNFATYALPRDKPGYFG